MRFITVLRQRHLALLWFSQVLSAIGDYFHTIAVIWLAVQVAGSAAGIVAGAQAGAALLCGLFGGVYADRWNRRVLMSVVDVVRAAAVGILPPLALTGRLQLWHLVIVAVIVGSLGALFTPALQASLPALSGDDRTLYTMNSLMDMTRRLARAVGPSLVGVLTAVVPLAHVFTVDALTFVVSALAIYALGTRFAWTPVPAARQEHARRSIKRDLAGAIQLVRGHRFIAWKLATDWVVALAWSAAFTVGVPLLAIRALGGGIGVYGLLVSAYGIGNVVSNLIVGNMPLQRHIGVMLLGRLIVAGGFLVMVSTPVVPVAVLGAALAATGGPMADVPFLSMIQTDVPSNQIGKVFGLDTTLERGGNMLGLLLAVPLSHYLPPVAGISSCALVIALPSAAALLRFGVAEPTVPASTHQPRALVVRSDQRDARATRED